MDLDHHGARAADSLRRRATAGLDLVAARATVAEAQHRRRAARRERLGSTVVAVLCVLGLGAVVLVASRHDAGPSFDRTGSRIGTDGTSVDRTREPHAASVLAAMPSSPIDGKASWRLPVLVQPQSGLQDGGKVTVYGRGFGANESLGIVQCSSEADTAGAGVGACQLARGDETYGGVTYATASAEGSVVADVVVHRFITTPAGEVDCRSAAERCIIGMGAISNYDESGGSYVGFAGQPAFPEPTLAVSPAGPFAPGQRVQASVRGIPPGRGIRMQLCRGDRCQDLVDTKAGATGGVDVEVVLQPAFNDKATGEPVACEDRCVLRADGIGVKGQSAAPLPPTVALAFTSPDPSGPVTTAPPVPLGEPTATTSTTAPTGGSGTSAPVTSAPPQTTTSTTAARDPEVSTTTAAG
ncbi:hypothetical protein KSP35_09390 [Aquihabitans sp. G128]|uniref:hypothetical protein n=1 Tax=Aquihabitans sp. G128 TaxID=2849779 RepID=UPI001C21C71C|nr:hypothetical protein [Aquihabitans sp. G128]QXC62971.1 hypothetical protein KSP35_09390 [Aquihabitans sp. G128]